jgi:Holliday junction DNA helicase RuvA
MFEYFTGKLVEKTPAYVVLETGGIGYLINITLNTYTEIKEADETKLLVHYVVREDAQVLYGFSTETERTLFRALISVSGVGAATALLVLSSLSASETYDAIVNGNASLLQSVKGIGGKTAQRIIVDLRDKLAKDNVSVEKLPPGHNTLKEEALSGLLILGFPKNAASRAVDRVLKEKPVNSVEELIKYTLKIL